MPSQRLHSTLCFLLTLSLAAFCLVGTTFASGPTKRNLYTFQLPPAGDTPLAALISDKAGNLYGTTSAGGTGGCLNGIANDGCGTVFELSPVNGGGWTYAVLYSFQGEADGEFPYGPLVRDAAGNLYGTTLQGDLGYSGVVFELSPPGTSAGAWTLQCTAHLSSNFHPIDRRGHAEGQPRSGQ
jgi:hypothetical protein